MLSDRFDARESVAIIWTASEQEENRTAAQQFVRQHYDAMLAKMPDEYAGKMPRLGHGLCSQPERDAFQDFFKNKAPQHPGGARNFAQALEDINICMATGRTQGVGVKQYFAKEKVSEAQKMSRSAVVPRS